MVIFEPCNYASNISFYHQTTRICDYPDWSVDEEQIRSLKRSFSTLAAGSAMWHGSHTFVGYSFDNNLMAVIGYLAHQASVSGLKTSSSVIHELSDTPRSQSAAQTSEDVTLMFSNEPVAQWSETLNTMDIPLDYYLTFSAIVGTVSVIIFPYFLAYELMSFLTYAIIGQESADFICLKYLPELRKELAQLQITEEEKRNVFNKIIGTLIKMMYAFIY
jgi:hypothetical protein